MAAKDLDKDKLPEEEKPLLHNVEAKEKDAIEEIEEVGADNTGNPIFKSSVEYSLRAAIMMCLLGSIVWVSDIRKPFPNQIQARIPLVICLFVFTINPLLGVAIQNAIGGINGTFWACLHMWVMNGIFPGGMKEGMSSTSPCAIFGWANFLVFTWLTLWCKCGIGTKMFFLATHIGFMLAFLDPMSTMPFSENFTISHKGTAVNTLLATVLGTLAAPLMNLLPYPMGSAYSNMKGAAVTASKDTGKLFETIIDYFAGSEASVVVESCVKHAGDLRASLDAMGGTIGAAWFEGFDIGTRGTVRALMESHLGLMNNIYDRLRAILVVVRSEDFGESHTAIMSKIRDASMRVALATSTLMVAVTEAATDGDISHEEKETLAGMVREAKAAVKQLAADFDRARKVVNTPVSKDLLGENYFVLTLSAYARLVIDYSEMMINNPPNKAVPLPKVISNWLSSTWDIKAMNDRFNLNFTVVHFVAIVFCWFYSVFVDNWGGGCVITAVFLMSPSVCPDIQAFLNVLNAVILAVIVGTLVFQWTCGSGWGDYILPFEAFILWTIGLYGYFAKSAFLLPCLVFVALTPFRWVTVCPVGDIAAGARATWAGMVANILAILFVCGFQYALGIDRANNLASNAMDDAFAGLRKAFDALWDRKDATEPMAPVAGDCTSGTGYCASAKIEPRFWRNSWKASLYMDIVASVQQLRLDILMLWFAVSGSDGVPEAIFDHFEDSSDFEGVKADLNQTLEDAHTLAIGMVCHEQGRFDGLSTLKTTTGIDELDALPGLMAHLNSKLKFPAEAPDTMEDDELCQISTVCMLLDCTVKHIAFLIKKAVRQT